MTLLIAPITASLFVTPLLPGNWDEGANGDLSDDHASPTPLVLNDGPNLVVASQEGPGVDIDYFTFDVPAGKQLELMTLDNYVSNGNNKAFIGIVQGSFFPKDAGSTKQADLLGGKVYGAAEIGQDLLPLMAGLNGAIGFTPPLGAGSYSIWMNQTGAINTTTLRLVLTDAPVGDVYCDESINANNVADIAVSTADSGAPSIFVSITNGPPNQFIYLLVGDGTGSVDQPPGAKGSLCVVGGSCLGRYDKDIGVIDAGGKYSLDLFQTVSTPCSGTVVIDSGSTWNFQMWHRQPMGQPATFSSAISVTFE